MPMGVESFRIIAIKPLPECDKKLLKNLSAGTTYYFFQNCTISENEELVEKDKFIPVTFFSTGSPSIEINAIVGKNGSGKSSVIELLLMTINNFSHKYKRFEEQLKFVIGLQVSLYFQLGPKFYKIEIKDGKANLFVFSKRNNKMINTDIVLRINEILERKGYTQKDLADKMKKRPSEINKWLKSNHNLTLKTIAKLEAELGEPIIKAAC